MTNYKRLCRQLTAELLKHEAKLSERQLMLLEWKQIGEQKIVLRHREAGISQIAYEGILALPSDNRFVFGRSPFAPNYEYEQSLKEKILTII
ncbi:MAG: hypothetical protein J6X18_03370 [Bacteroidales bacterium]|nr:hypothetical protein [Bacteroidales bacterium]